MDVATFLLLHFLYPAKQKTLAGSLLVLVTKIINKNSKNLRCENKNQQEVSNTNDAKFPKW